MRARQIPQQHRALFIDAHEFVVRSKSERPNFIAMAAENGGRTPGITFPNPNGLIGTGAGEELAIR